MHLNFMNSNFMHKFSKMKIDLTHVFGPRFEKKK